MKHITKRLQLKCSQQLSSVFKLLQGRMHLTNILDSSWLRGTVVRTLVCDRWTFPVPRSTFSWWVNTYVG